MLLYCIDTVSQIGQCVGYIPTNTNRLYFNVLPVIFLSFPLVLLSLSSIAFIHLPFMLEHLLKKYNLCYDTVLMLC